jgi:cytochrome c oxidase cbb3-type subunit 1
MSATLAKSGGLFLAMIIALFGMAQAQDTAFAVHMGIMALAALIAALAVMKDALFTPLPGPRLYA